MAQRSAASRSKNLRTNPSPILLAAKRRQWPASTTCSEWWIFCTPMPSTRSTMSLWKWGIKGLITFSRIGDVDQRAKHVTNTLQMVLSLSCPACCPSSPLVFPLTIMRRINTNLLHQTNIACYYLRSNCATEGKLHFAGLFMGNDKTRKVKK